MDKRRSDWWRDFEPFVDRMVSLVAHRYMGRVEREELRQSALLALVEAGTRFDPEREATFAAYVRTRVTGAIRDAARRETMRKQRGQLARAFPGTADGHVPLRRVAPESLDSPLMPLDPARYVRPAHGERQSIESEMYYRDFVRSLRDRLESLPDRERRSVEVCDLEGASFARAGERLGCTGGGVFRMRQRALGRLRAGMN